jgi:biotin-[acetyl-CoA-carboxylase] ligase BirA-like protein
VNQKNAFNPKFKFLHLKKCECTQDTALAMSMEFGNSVVVLADSQTQGRGRRGREWVSDESKSLTMSLAVANFNHQENAGLLSLLAGAALAITLENVDAKFSELSLKWPNDLGKFDGDTFKKVAGVLIEVKKQTLIVGWGINLKGKAPWPEALSLQDICATALPPKEELCQSIASTFLEAANKTMNTPSFAAQLLEYLNNKAMKSLWSRPLGRNWQGHTAHGLSADGSLITRDQNNQPHHLYSGEV